MESIVLARRQLSDVHLAAAGFLARYQGNTFHAYAKDLEILFAWCADRGLDPLLDVRRPHLELFARYLEIERCNGPASVHRRMSTVRCFYRIATIDEFIDKSPAEYVRMPKVHRDHSNTLGLERMELGALVATARASRPSEWGLVVLMGLLGLRVSEACAVQIEQIHDFDRGYRVLRVTGKGGKPATFPLPVPVARALDSAAGERTSGPLLLRVDGKQMNRQSAAKVITRLRKKAGIGKHITPHSLRHSFITAALDAGVPLRDVQEAARHADPRQTIVYDRSRGSLDRHAVHFVAAFIAGAS